MSLPELLECKGNQRSHWKWGMASLYALHNKVAFSPTKTVAFDIGRTIGLARTRSMKEENRYADIIKEDRLTNRSVKVTGTWHNLWVKRNRNPPIKFRVFNAHPDDHAPSTYEMTPGSKSFTVLSSLLPLIARVLRSRRSARETPKILRKSLITPLVSRDSETKIFLQFTPHWKKPVRTWELQQRYGKGNTADGWFIFCFTQKMSIKQFF